MAKVLSNSGIITGLPVEAHHVSQSVNALTAAEAYDINISGSLTVNGVLYPITDGTTGQVLTTDGSGTATFQNLTADTASYVSSSNVDGPFGMDSILSASYAVSSSRSEFAKEASSSLFAINAQTAVTADTSSLASTASFVTASNLYGPYGTSSVESSSIALTASYISSSNVFGPFGLDSILSASFAITAAYAENAGGAPAVDTGSFVTTSSISGLTQSFTKGDGSTYENYIQSSSYAVTASYIEMAEPYRQDFTGVSTINIPHNLNTRDLIVEVYRQDASTGNVPVMIIPSEIRLTNFNQLQLNFSAFETGYVIVTDGGGIAGQAVSSSQAQSSSYALTASFALNAAGTDTGSFVITSSITGFTQSFTKGDGSTYTNLLPDTLESASYAVTSSHALTASYVDIAETFKAEFTNVTTFVATHGFNSENLNIDVYRDDATTGNIPNQMQPDRVRIVNLNQVELTFAGPTTGFVVISKGGFLKLGSVEFAQTASYANSASFADTASFIRSERVLGPSGYDSILSSSYAITASHLTGDVPSASYAVFSDTSAKTLVYVQNDDSVTLVKGTPVYSVDTNGRAILVRSADASDADKLPAIGVLDQDLNVNDLGYAVIAGRVSGLNTFGLQEGRNVYVAPGGGWTQTKPTESANYIQSLGILAKQNASDGEILIEGPGRVNDLPNIQSGHVWVGNNDDVPVAIPTSSLVTSGSVGSGSFVTTSSISGFTQSFTRGDGTSYENYIDSASYAVTASYIEMADTIRARYTNEIVFIATHGFNSENVMVDVYEESAATGNIPTKITPSSVRLVSLNQVEVRFAAPTTGFVIVSKGGFLRLGTVEFAQSASYATTASFVVSASHAEFADDAISSSYAESSSYTRYSEQARDVVLPVINDDSVNLVKGTPAYIEEFDGTHYNVYQADASNEARLPALGVITSDLAVGERGELLLVGDIEEINTFGLNQGDNIYVAPGGGWTQTKPTGSDKVQPIGIVAEVSVNGRLIIQGPASYDNLANLQEGFFWVGDANDTPVQVPTSSLSNVGVFVTSSSITGNIQTFLLSNGASYTNVIESASFASSASVAQSSSYALTASHVPTTEPANYTFNGNIINIPHNLNTENIFIQVYEDSPVTGNIPQMIIPTSIVLNDLNNATITLPIATTGFVLVSIGGFLQKGSLENAFSSSYALSASHAMEAETASYTEKAEKTTFSALNDDVVTIQKSDPVFIDEFDGVHYRIFRANASDLTRMPAIGVADRDLVPGAVGEVVITGDVDGLNTFGLNAGQNIFVAPGGGWTQTRPTGSDLVQPVGVLGEVSPTLGRVIVQGPAAPNRLPNLTSGSIFIGNSDSVPEVIPTSSILPDSSSYANTASYALELAPSASLYKENVAGAVTYNITHNLNEDFPVVQVYELPTRQMVVPDSVQSITADVIQVTFVVVFNGVIVVQK